MEFIVSTKVICNVLSKVYGSNQHTKIINDVSFNDGKLIFAVSNDELYEIVVKLTRANCDSFWFKHIDVRWDWVYNLVKNIPEQPMVLCIYTNGVECKFQY